MAAESTWSSIRLAFGVKSMEARRRLSRFVLAIVAAYWLAIFCGTHLPRVPALGVSHGDKLIHFGAYAGLAFLLSLYVRPRSVRAGLLVLAVVATYGAFDELSQGLVPHRTPDWNDWCADLCGAVVGLCAFALGDRIALRRRKGQALQSSIVGGKSRRWQQGHLPPTIED